MLWVVFALVAFAGSFLLGIGFLGPTAKRIETVGPETDEGQRLIRKVFAVLRVDLLFLFAIVLAMTVKPTGDDVGIVIVAAAILAGGNRCSSCATSSGRRRLPRRAEEGSTRSSVSAAAAAAAAAATAAPDAKLGFAATPCTANAESCRSTSAAPQLGQVTTCSSFRTSSSKCSSHSMHAYS